MKIILKVLIIFAIFGSVGCGRDFTFDYVIINGKIVDGTGNPWYKADLGIRGEKIIKIGKITVDEAKTIIDARGQIVAPGFIDIHTHSEANIFEVPTAQNYITQGVTTVIGGNCGGSPLSVRKTFAKIDSQNIALNLAVLIGQGSVRNEIVGKDDVKPTPEQMEAMKGLVRDAMEEGAVGLSTGLEYHPGCYAETDEIIELAKVVSEYGGFYATHLRNEGVRGVESIQEAIEIGEKAGVPVEISHFKVSSSELWGSSTVNLRLIEEARERGVDVKVDQYPYRASHAGLPIMFPPWSLEGGRDTVKARIEDPQIRARMKEGIKYNIVHDGTGPDLSNIYISYCKHDSTIEGKTIAEILVELGREPNIDNGIDYILDLYYAGSASAIYFCMSDEDVERIMAHPAAMHASDGGVAVFGRGFPHPRNYGTFPRILGRYVREKKHITLENAVRKMTSMPASMTGIRDRGIVAEGFIADITIFNPETVIDKASFEDPHQHPDGLSHVFVNGEPVVFKGKITNQLPGKAIYGPGVTQ